MQYFLALTIFIFSLTTQAADQSGRLKIKNAYSPEMPPVVKILAGYMELHNPSNKDITITGVSSPDFEHVEIHSMVMSDGMMHMVRQDKLVIPANGQINLEPGDLHVMFINKSRNFRMGDHISLTIKYEQGSQTIKVPVRKTE